MTLRDALGNTWGKILMALLLPAILAGVALVREHEKVAQLEAITQTHVTRVEVQGQYEAILREIAALREDVRDLRHTPR